MIRNVLVGFAVLLSVTSNSHAQDTGDLASKCGRIEKVNSGSYVYKNSAPLRSGGVGTPMIGYRKEPTLIMKRRGAASSTQIYDSNGKVLGRCPWTSAHGFSGGRFRCTMSTGGLRRAAVRSSRKPTVYFRLNKSTCVEVPDAGRCYGSVKGLCNRTIS